MAVLEALVQKGNTVLVIEHNMDVVKMADWIVDMGPAGGAQGGRILFSGAPEDLVRTNTHTAAFLRKELERFDGVSEEESPELDADALASESERKETLTLSVSSPA